MVERIAGDIMPLLDELAAPSDLSRATTAIFYSISNTQAGLRGVSFGDSLIKRVVESLKEEFPKLKTFATLSPIPGFRSWLGKNAAAMLEKLGEKERSALGRAVGFEPPGAGHLLTAVEDPLSLGEKSPVRKMLLQCAAHYLGRTMEEGKPLDPVARFHLGNGARVERINWAGDPTPKGLKQSYGLMVNYLYDLKRLDRHRAQLAQGEIPVSGTTLKICTFECVLKMGLGSGGFGASPLNLGVLFWIQQRQETTMTFSFHARASRRDILRAAAAGAATLSLWQPRPVGLADKPVTVIVPFPAGGGTDAFARPLSAQFAKLTGTARHRQPRRRRRHLGASIASRAAARRLHAVHGRGAPRDRAVDVSQARLRHREGLCAAGPAGQCAAGGGGQPPAAMPFADFKAYP